MQPTKEIEPTIQSPWMDTREGARYVGFTSRNAWRTVNRWIRRGLVPEQYVGQRGRDLLVKPEGLDAAVRAIRSKRKPWR